MCLMLQTCDSMAYTDMALTRSDNNVYYENSPSFNNSFNRPTGYAVRGAKLKTYPK